VNVLPAQVALYVTNAAGLTYSGKTYATALALQDQFKHLRPIALLALINAKPVMA
jgi:hypothetical protein